MHPQTLYPKTRQVLEKLQRIGFLKDWYLAGGTGLALQLGHRKSIDIDLFTEKFPKKEILTANILHLNPTIIQEAPGTLDTTIDGVKVSFLEYKYPTLEDFALFEKVKVASVLDIACMKITAISSRGSKKDFVDLFFILKKYTLGEIFNALSEKYKNVSYQELHLLKSITYFADANNDPDPDLIEDVQWNNIKKYLEKEIKAYLRNKTQT